jgi:hypothetical protein
MEKDMKYSLQSVACIKACHKQTAVYDTLLYKPVTGRLLFLIPGFINLSQTAVFDTWLYKPVTGRLVFLILGCCLICLSVMGVITSSSNIWSS